LSSAGYVDDLVALDRLTIDSVQGVGAEGEFGLAVPNSGRCRGWVVAAAGALDDLVALDRMTTDSVQAVGGEGELRLLVPGGGRGRGWAVAAEIIGTFDDLTLLDGLAEGSVEVDASRQLGVLTVLVVDEVHLGLGGGVRHLDDLLLARCRPLAQQVHQSLLLRSRSNDGSNPVAACRRAHEHEVVVDLRRGQGRGRPVGEGLFRGVKEVQRSTDHWRYGGRLRR